MSKRKMPREILQRAINRMLPDMRAQDIIGYLKPTEIDAAGGVDALLDIASNAQVTVRVASHGR